MVVLLWLKSKLQYLLQIDIDYFLKGGFWITFDNFINMGISFLLGIALIKTFSQSDYGTYRYIFSILGILQIFIFGGMNSAVVQAVARGEEGVFKKIVNFRLRYSFIFILASSIVAFYYFYYKNFQISYSLVILGLLYPIISALGTYQAFLQGKKEFRYSALLSLISQIILTSLMIASLLITKKIIFVVLTHSLVNLFINSYFYWKIINKFKPNAKDGGGAVDYGKKLTFLQLFAILAKQLDQLLLFHFWGPAILANYAVAKFFPDYIYSLLKSTTNLLVPKISPQSLSEISRFFYKRIFQSLLIGSIIGSLYAILAPILFFIFFKKYSDMVFYSQILSIDLIFALINSFIGSIFISKKLVKSIYLSQIINSLLRMTLFVIMGISGGMIGMIIAHILGLVVGTVLNIVFWELERRRLPILLDK